MANRLNIWCILKTDKEHEEKMPLKMFLVWKNFPVSARATVW